MDALAGYGSSSSGDEAETTLQTKRRRIDAAPTTAGAMPLVSYLPSSTDLMLHQNIPLAALERPLVGPANPFAKESLQHKNILSGHVEAHSMSDVIFQSMQRTFDTYGYTLDPETGKVVGNVEKAASLGGKLMQDKNKNEGRRKRKPKGTADEVDAFAGPWAGYEGEESEDEEAALALANAGTVTGAIAAAEKAKEAQEEEDVSAQVSEDGPRQKKSDDYLYSAHEKSKFHGKAETDYMGRTYIHVPQDLDVDLTKEAGSQECFLPKKCLHTWTGHTKGVNTIKLFPKSGHLMLSGSQDTKIKLWDVYHDRKCLRTFMGHDKAIRDISFSNDGRRFLSASFDKWIKLWDTETGQCLGRYTTKRIPFCVTFNPDDDKQNIFLTGCQDKKIYQFDMNSGKVTQEYDQHLGGVNSVTFIDQGRRFISTSDDKTIRAWEYDIPVVVKYIADPSMHSMPATALSPNQKWLALTSLDNQIFVYGVGDKIRANNKKNFRGHIVAGYAIKPSFSPDGQYVTSGDSTGNLWFWDWKTTKVVKKFKAHNSVVMAAEWLPHETSKVVTCSWDSTIKLWD